MNNETLDVLLSRTSLRSYDEGCLTEEEENIILNAAIHAPTAGNQTLFSMIIVRNKAKKEELASLCDNQGFIAKAPFVVVFAADQHRWFDYFRMMGVKEFCEKENLPYVGVDYANLLLAFEDTLAAAENAVIAAESINIGSCFIGGILEHYEKIKELFKLPDETFPISLLCFGRYKKDYKKVFTQRFDKKYIAFEDEYKQLSRDEYTDMFKQRENNFFERNPYHAENFAQMMYAGKIASSVNKERNRSVRAGFADWTKSLK